MCDAIKRFVKPLFVFGGAFLFDGGVTNRNV